MIALAFPADLLHLCNSQLFTTFCLGFTQRSWRSPMFWNVVLRKENQICIDATCSRL